MKAVYITGHGGPEVLTYGDVPRPLYRRPRRPDTGQGLRDQPARHLFARGRARHSEEVRRSARAGRGRGRRRRRDRRGRYRRQAGRPCGGQPHRDVRPVQILRGGRDRVLSQTPGHRHSLEWRIRRVRRRPRAERDTSAGIGHLRAGRLPADRVHALLVDHHPQGPSQALGDCAHPLRVQRGGHGSHPGGEERRRRQGDHYDQHR